MKDWIKNLKDEEITSLLKMDYVLEDIPVEKDELIKRNLRVKIAQSQKKPTFFSSPGIRRYFGFGMAAALFLVIFIPIFYFIFTVGARGTANIVFLTGECNIIRNGKTLSAKIGDKIVEGDLIHTLKDTKTVLSLSERRILKLDSLSRIEFLSITPDKVECDLKYGRVLYNSVEAELKKKVILNIKTLNAFTRASNATFFVDYSNSITEAAVYRGEVDVKMVSPVQENPIVILNKGNAIVIDKNEALKKEVSSKALVMLREFEDYPFIQGKEKPSTLNIIVDKEKAILKINSKKIDLVSRKISLLLDSGEYIVELDKQGYKTYRKSIILNPDQSMKLNISLKQNITEENKEKIRKFETKIDPEKLFPFKRYKYINMDNPLKSDIIGFSISTDYAIAITKTSLFCINKDGLIVWSKDYGESKKLIFDSIPLIFNNKIYISSNYKILVLDLEKGYEIYRINAPGIVSHGYNLVQYGNKIYIPYSEGIYSFDMIKASLSEKPVIEFENPSSPVFWNEHIYVASYINGEIAVFDLDGNKKGNFVMDSQSIFPPVLIDEYLITGDLSGKLYRFSYDLLCQDSIKLFEGVVGIEKAGKKTFFALSEKGNLYMCDGVTLALMKNIQISNNSTKSENKYKKPFIYKGFLFIGTKRGDIKIINVYNGEELLNLNVSTFPLSCSVSVFNNMLLAGTKGGEIVILKNK